MVTEKMCPGCGYCFWQWSKLKKYCDTCTFNRLKKPRKPLKRMGRIAKQWAQTRKEWVDNNPPDASGQWECYLQMSPDCLKRITLDTLNVEHMESRARRPDLRFEQSNLAPACGPCNELKGSRSAAELEGKHEKSK